MKWLLSILESIPVLSNLFSNWIELQREKLPMKKDKHEERKPVREVDAKWDAERRNDKGRIVDIKRDAKIDRKEEKIEAKKQFGRFWRIKRKKHKKKNDN